MSRLISLARLAALAVLGATLALWGAKHAMIFVGPAPMSVWFMPAANSPDITDLFTKPEQWSDTRRRIDGFVFSPAQVRPPAPGRNRTPPDLAAVDAFRALTTFGLNSVLQVPALKEWDCAARRTSAVTVDLMTAVYERGGRVQFLEMDEPLISALGLNSPICKLDIATAAAEVAAYARSVAADPKVLQSGTVPRMVDIEAYPSLTVRQMETWITALAVQNFRPDAFHIDVNLQYIDRAPATQANLVTDLQELQKFLRTQGITFGIIIWSGRDPEKSDEDFYIHTMKWISVIHEAIGQPDRAAFESWVRRCTRAGDCSRPDFGCSTSDPVDCGTVSVPRNLPENDQNIFSHTRLIRDALAVLNRS